jgi:hypothetical protein
MQWGAGSESGWGYGAEIVPRIADDCFAAILPHVDGGTCDNENARRDSAEDTDGACREDGEGWEVHPNVESEHGQRRRRRIPCLQEWPARGNGRHECSSLAGRKNAPSASYCLVAFNAVGNSSLPWSTVVVGGYYARERPLGSHESPANHAFAGLFTDCSFRTRLTHFGNSRCTWRPTRANDACIGQNDERASESPIRFGSKCSNVR